MAAKPSVRMAQALTVFFLLLLAVMEVAAPWVVHWYIGLRGMTGHLFPVILSCWYACSIPAALALVQLLRLLHRIAQEQVFCRENVRTIHSVSWCALCCAVFCSTGGIWYAPFFLITAVMLFLFVLVQVVAACFGTAVTLAEENSLTI